MEGIYEKQKKRIEDLKESEMRMESNLEYSENAETIKLIADSLLSTNYQAHAKTARNNCIILVTAYLPHFT